MAGTPLAISLSVDTDGLISGLRVAGQNVDGAAQQMRASFHTLEKESGGALGGVVEHIRGMRQEMRLGNFMAAQIADMGLAAKGTAAEFTGLFSAFALGGGIGVAVEGIKLIVKAFTELGAEEAKQEEEFRKFAADLAEGTKKLADSVTESLMKMHGATEAEILQHAKIAPLLEQEAEQAKALTTARNNLKAAKEAESHSDTEAVANATALAQAQREYDKVLGEHSATLKALSADYEQLDILFNAEAVQEAEEAAEEQAKIDDALYTKKLKHLEDDYRAHQKYLNDVSKAEFGAAKALQKMGDEQLQYKINLNARAEKDEDKAAADRKKRVDELARDFDKFGKQAVNAVVSVIDGTRSLGQAMAELGRQLVTDMLDVLVKIGAQAMANAIIGVSSATTLAAANKVAATSMAQGDIAISAMEAATSVAWLGPEAAAAAAASTAAALEGIALPLLSASGGFDVPAGVNPVAQLHASEMVLPAQYADVIRSMAGSGGGGDVHLHFHNPMFVDRHSLKNLPQDPHFISGVREAIRNGSYPAT